jgi:hypothetical protein
MAVTDITLPERDGEREVIRNGDSLRVAHPLACIERCASETELDFLQRFFEASDFAGGAVRVFDGDEPIGRYALHAKRIKPADYVKFEIQSYQWVRRFGLGREWGTIAEMFIRMSAGRTETGMVDWGVFLTNCDDEKVAYGGAQVSMRMLGLRLKDAYRDFFRFYKTMQEEAVRGKEMSPREALREIERDVRYREWINEFKENRGLTPK